MLKSYFSLKAPKISQTKHALRLLSSLLVLRQVFGVVWILGKVKGSAFVGLKKMLDL